MDIKPFSTTDSYNCHDCYVQANRRQHREEAVSNSNRNNKKLISKLLKYHAIGNAVAPSTSSQSKAVLSSAAPKQDDQDLFQLPPIPTVQPDVNSQSG